MNRSSLTAFLSLLVGLLGFSAVTGVASFVWRPPASSREKAPQRATSADRDDDSDVDASDERGPWSRRYKNGKLRGQITDARTHEPMAGASVSMTRYSSDSQESAATETREGDVRVIRVGATPTSKTDVNGRYELKVMPTRGRFQLRISMDQAGYRDSYQWMGFDGDATWDGELDHDPWLTGKVTDGSGAAITNYQITAKQMGLFGVAGSQWTRSFKGDEPFRFPLTKGTWDVTATAGTRRSKTSRVSVGREDVNIDFVVDPR